MRSCTLVSPAQAWEYEFFRDCFVCWQQDFALQKEPETLEHNEFTGASDVYAYGIIVWEMLTKKVPWQGKTAGQPVGFLQSSVSD